MTTTNPSHPEQYLRRILLTLMGHSPAIITETLYALTQKQDPAFIPTEIHVITTSSGKSTLLQKLVDEAVLQTFCSDYKIAMPAFDESYIHVITGADGHPLPDLQTEQDNEAAADFITNQVRELTKDDDTSLHVSIAGGRKTMSYYLGYALSVFGRIQDHMSHVLVDDRYAIPGFYYPTPGDTILTNSRNSILVNSRTGDSFNAKDVVVTLGKLPFIRLRDGLTDDLLNDKKTSYSQLIEIAQRQLAPISVRVVFGEEPKLFCGGEEIPLPPAQLALYVWMLQRHKASKPPVKFTDKAAQTKLAEEFKAVYAQLSHQSGHYANAEESIKIMDTGYFGPHRTNINKKLAMILGKPKAKAYEIAPKGGKHAKQYNLSKAMQPEYISIESPLETTEKESEQVRFLTRKLV